MGDSKIYIIQHVPYEGPGFIAEWLKREKRSYEEVLLYDQEPFPSMSEIDGLIIMGGPMGVYDEEAIPWMLTEKKFIQDCIESEIPVLGICLGAQLIADVLGSDVYRHKYQEIGWFEVQQRSQGTFVSDLDEYIVFHWHGDTYDLPKKAVHLFESKACSQQGFQYKDHVVALQFHLEIGRSEIGSMEKQIKSSLKKGPYIQNWDDILGIDDHHELENKKLLFNILENLFN